MHETMRRGEALTVFAEFFSRFLVAFVINL
jgi:hypothetical protein